MSTTFFKFRKPDELYATSVASQMQAIEEIDWCFATNIEYS
jgi:hypothetical protein